MRKIGVLLLRRRWAWVVLIFVLAMNIAACGNRSDVFSISELLFAQDMEGADVYVDTCMLSSRHEIALVDCSDASMLLAVLASEELKGTEKWTEFRAYSYAGWTTKSKKVPSARLFGELMVDEKTGKRVFLVKKVVSLEMRDSRYGDSSPDP